MLDKIDKEIIMELQEDAKRKTYQLSKKLNVPRTTIHNRIKRLEKDGFIKRYSAVVNPEKIGKPLTVLIGIVTGEEVGSRAVAAKIRKFAQIEDIYIVAGHFGIIIKVRLKDMNELASMIFGIDSGMRSIHGISKTESMIVLETDKEYGAIEPA
jgi:Lrp/AsnC family transcriptional regulator for asnA, asnC and gidA